MSQENVELVRNAYAAFNAGEMRAFLAFLDREIIWKPLGEGIDPSTRSGHTGVRRYYETRLEVLDELREEPEELLDGGEKIVAFVKTSSRGKASGIEVSDPCAHVWTLRSGKAIRFEIFAERSEAMAVAGLEPRAG